MRFARSVAEAEDEVESGRWLAWLRLRKVLWPEGDEAIATWEMAASVYLFNRGYCSQTIRQIMNVAWMAGSVEDVRISTFAEHDRRMVEDLIPGAREGRWARPEFSGTWSTTGEDIPC